MRGGTITRKPPIQILPVRPWVRQLTVLTHLEQLRRQNMLRLLGLQFAVKSIVASRAYHPVHYRSFRTFSTTPRRQAAEVPDDFINAIKHTPLFQKLADKPNALKALSDLYSLTKDMGTFPLLCDSRRPYTRC